MHRAEELEMGASLQGSRLENKMGITCEKLSELKWETLLEREADAVLVKTANVRKGKEWKCLRLRLKRGDS